MEQENVLTKKFYLKEIFNSFWSKHSAFFSTVYTIAFYLSMLLAFIDWLKLIFDSIRSGNFFSFVFGIILQSIIMTFGALLGAAVYGTVAVVIFMIPYLVIRGFIRK